MMRREPIAPVLGNMQPLMTLLLAALFLGESLTPAKLIALLLGLSGAVLALAASGGSAASNVIAKRIQMRHNLPTITAWQLVIGSLPLLIVSALVERDTPIIWTVQFVGLLLFLALVGTSLAVAAWYWLVQQEDVGRLTCSFSSSHFSAW